MANAVLDTVSVDIDANGCNFRATGWKAAARKEFAEPPNLDDHRLAADLADLACLLVGNAHPFAVHSLFRFGK